MSNIKLIYDNRSDWEKDYICELFTDILPRLQ